MSARLSLPWAGRLGQPGRLGQSVTFEKGRRYTAISTLPKPSPLVPCSAISTDPVADAVRAAGWSDVVVTIVDQPMNCRVSVSATSVVDATVPVSSLQIPGASLIEIRDESGRVIFPVSVLQLGPIPTAPAPAPSPPTAGQKGVSTGLLVVGGIIILVGLAALVS